MNIPCEYPLDQGDEAVQHLQATLKGLFRVSLVSTSFVFMELANGARNSGSKAFHVH